MCMKNVVVAILYIVYKLINSLFPYFPNSYRGHDSELEEPFRAEYGCLAELQSILRRDVPFIALTATATDAVRTTIIKD